MSDIRSDKSILSLLCLIRQIGGKGRRGLPNPLSKLPPPIPSSCGVETLAKGGGSKAQTVVDEVHGQGARTQRNCPSIPPPIPRYRSVPPFPIGFAPDIASLPDSLRSYGICDVRDLRHGGPDSSLVRGARLGEGQIFDIRSLRPRFGFASYGAFGLGKGGRGRGRADSQRAAMIQPFLAAAGLRKGEEGTFCQNESS